MTPRVCRPTTSPAYPVPALHTVAVKTYAGARTHAVATATPVPAGAHVFVGAQWTDVRPSSAMDATIASMTMQMQTMIEFGAGNPWPTSTTPSSFAGTDAAMQDVRDAGAIEKVLGFHKAPGWMKTSGNTSDDTHPTPANFANFANISAQAATRYSDFQWGMIWHEYKAFWDNNANRPDVAGFTDLYTQVFNAVRAVRPTMKLGGPYTTLISSSPGAGSHPSSVIAGSWGQMDQRWLDATSDFVANCPYDFLSWDGGPGHAPWSIGGLRWGGHDINNAGVTAEQQLDKIPLIIAWIRSLSSKANTVPIICAESYVQDIMYAAALPQPQPGYPGGVAGGDWGGGYGRSASSAEDYFIEMCRRAQAASPNGPVYFLTWFHPAFWPQVVDKSNDFAWANTTSAFHPKVLTWHANGV